ncbi:DMT family transporter [Cognatishimia sp. F0-27]|uniref:DMT family transporter n=1 Tax=Cognatishimia sp. F0-27 TaxID=2816855 RepID=UPI001D0C5860|nr:DMT family transporter [Cognatishimia sp. F0-27]MCC1494987.1 DMT family transporter [Cognatishimia sp. F0-27]
MATLTDNTRGALIMTASMACFTFGDTCVKALGTLGMPLSQILVIRGILATSFILGLAWWLGQLRFRMSRRDASLVALRSIAEAAAAYFFLTALIHMPLANVTALLQMLPLTVTLGSAVFFAEPVGWRRWMAIAIGFVGMVLIVRPGTEGFDLHAVYALIAVLGVTLRDLVTRRLSKTVPSLTVTVCSSFAVLIFAAIWSVGQEWVAVDGSTGLWLLGASVLIIGGYTFSVMVMRVGDVSFTAPFRYTGLVWALLLGWLVFGDWPSELTLIGASMIVGTGLFTLWREKRVARAAQRPIS